MSGRSLKRRKEEVDYKVGDWEYLLGEIAGAHRTVMGAFKEILSNSIDAGATEIGVIENIDAGRIAVRDNGEGMDLKTMKEIPQSIGKSSKRGERNKIGEKQLAFLAFNSYGEKETIVSKKEGAEVYGVLELTRISDRSQIKRPQIYYLERGENLELESGSIPIDFNHGTMVFLEGIDPSIMKGQLNQNKIVEELAETYHPRLKTGEFKITTVIPKKTAKGVKDVKKTVEPLEFRGKLVLDEEVRFDFGSMHIELYINPKAANEKIRLYNKGVKVFDSITELPEFKDMPWKTGKISGYVDADFLSLNIGRDAFVFNRSFQYWRDTIQSYSDMLENELRSLEEEAEEEKFLELMDRVVRSISDAYRKLEPLYEGALAMGGEGDKSRRVIRNIKRGERTPRRGKGGSEKPRGREIILESEKGRPKKVRKAAAGMPFSIDIVEFDPPHSKMRSNFSKTYEKILINKAHPDFKEKVQKSKNVKVSLGYIADLVTKECGYGEFIFGCEIGAISEENNHKIVERQNELFYQVAKELGL